MTPPRAGSAAPTHGAHSATAAYVQRRSAFDRLVVAHPWAAHAVPVAVVVLLGTVTSGLASETVRGAAALGLFSPGAEVHDHVVRVWVAGTALGALLLVARRSRPLTTTVVLTALTVLSLQVAGVVGVLSFCSAWALHSVAARNGARTTWIAGTSVLVVVTVAVWRWQDIGIAEMLVWSSGVTDSAGNGTPVRQLTEPEFSAGRRSGTVLLLLTLLVLGGVTGAGARARRVHAHDLAQRYAAMARERDTSAALARSMERARIAREMHDIVAHSVAVMVALSDGAASALDRAPAASRHALAELSKTGREALGDMRAVLSVLGPADPGGGLDHHSPPTPTGPDLHTIVDRFRAAGLPVTTSGLQSPLPPDTALRLAVVRILTEGLTNTLRHAPGTPLASIALRCTPTTVEVEIIDAGGTRPGSDRGAHRGLLGMRERADLLGGHVEAGPRDTGGWRVHVVLPINGSTTGDHT